MTRVLRPAGASLPWRHERFTTRVLLPVLQALLQEARGWHGFAAEQEASARGEVTRHYKTVKQTNAPASNIRHEYAVFERALPLPREVGYGLSMHHMIFEPSWAVRHPVTLKDTPVERGRMRRKTKKGSWVPR